ncbi:MAG TPA: glycoside hydrolase family 57 protein [Bacteroidales bacterium]|nr:glycoside hydrolase family 57 protein [Bacteroidales bacterium]
MSSNGKKAICFYFQVHQPFRLKRYRFFDLGHDHYYYDDYSNEAIMRKVAEKCYLPANKILLDLIEKHKGKFKVSFSISGIAINQFRLYAPEVLESFHKLAETGMVEFLGETNAHSLASLKSRSEFELQVNQHKAAVKQFLGVEPVTFRNTELIYSDEIGSWVADLGYKAMLTEGAKHILGWKSPNYLYCNAVNPRLKVLLRNFVLSDDIAFRFSNKDWIAWPLTADKYAGWINKLASSSELLNIFLDYETFGEHNWKESGIFDFLQHMPASILKKTPFKFMTPSEVADKLLPVSAINVQNPISWADEERDITAWLGNELQAAALEKLYSLSRKVNRCDDNELKKDWEYLQSSDHFYYMATKFFSDGAVHAYFNPYESPYDAFMNYMNVLNDFEIRLNRSFPDTAEQDQIYKLGNQVIEKEMIIEKQTGEIIRLKKKLAKTATAEKSSARKLSKADEIIIEWEKTEKKPEKKSVKRPAVKSASAAKSKKDEVLNKSVVKKTVKTTRAKSSVEKKKSAGTKVTSDKKRSAAEKPVPNSTKTRGRKKSE